MKIAYLGLKGLPSKGGTERVVEALIKRLAVKHEITVYCDSAYTPAGTEYPGVRLLRFSSIPGKYTRPTILFMLHALHALLFGDYDLIHMHGVDACFTLPFLRLRYNVLSTSHGSHTRTRRKKWGKAALFLLRQTEYPFCKLSNYATSVSYADARFYREHYHTKVVYIPNGMEEDVSYDLRAACSELDRYGVQPGNYLLFAAGRVDPSKGCHLAIEAYNRINPGIPLLVIGDLNQVSTYADSLRQMAANRPVIFIPLITCRELLYGLVKMCRLFIFPSLNEGCSIMLLEAVSLGVPMICSDIEENVSVLKNTVLYFKSGDDLDLAGKLTYALSNPEYMCALSEKARILLSRSFTWDRIAECYDRLYKTCMQGGAFPDIDQEWLTER